MFQWCLRSLWCLSCVSGACGVSVVSQVPVLSQWCFRCLCCLSGVSGAFFLVLHHDECILSVKHFCKTVASLLPISRLWPEFHLFVKMNCVVSVVFQVPVVSLVPCGVSGTCGVSVVSQVSCGVSGACGVSVVYHVPVVSQAPMLSQ